MTEWAVKPGDKIRVFSPEGDPRDTSTDLSQAYVVSDPFILQPSYIKEFIKTEPLSKDEIQRLEADLRVTISKEMFAEVHRAISEFICTVALDGRMATWKQIQNQLRLILKTCNTVILSAQFLVNLISSQVIDDSVSRGVLSADQLVKQMLLDRQKPNKTILEVDLASIIVSCSDALQLIKTKTKRGRKPESIFRLLLKRLEHALSIDDHDLKLPSNENVFGNVPPTFVFIVTALEICIEKGKVAIVASELDDAEKKEAIRVLSHFKKSPRAIVHYFRTGSLK